MKNFKGIGVGVLIGIVIAGIVGGLLYWQSSRADEPEIQTSATIFKVKDIGQLDVANVFYDKTVNQTQNGKILWFKVGNETALYIFHFKAQVYYDMNKATMEYDEAARTVSVKLPKAQIKLLLKDSEYSVDYDYYKVHDSMFVSDDNSKGLSLQKKAIKEVEKDILKQEEVIPMAKKNAQKMIEQMYAPAKVQVKVTFA